MPQMVSRRTFAAGVVAASVSLAGCSGNGDDGDDGGDTGDSGSYGGGSGGGDDSEPTDSETTDGAGSSPTQADVTVGPGGELRFDPESLDIAAGTAVTFTWDSPGHNIVVDSQPDGADWGGVDDIQDEGYTHEHTFDVAGEYAYYCEPHRGSGMEATVTVTEA